MTHPFFEILAPAIWSLPAVFNSPHSGAYMPPAFLALTPLNERELRQSEDCFVDELFAGCTSFGAPLMRALVSRAYVDLNREPYELDARMFNDPLPGYMNTGSVRVSAGFGTVPRFVGDGRDIYRNKLDLSEALGRIENFYRPYHRRLSELIDEAKRGAGLALLIDCHSMPGQISPSKPVADIVLGDRFGTSCHPALTSGVEDYFRGHGLHVVRNKPYAGAFITSTYGAPQHGQHAIQIEVNRSLYMREASFEKTASFSAMARVMSGLAVFLPNIINEIAEGLPESLAAE